MTTSNCNHARKGAASEIRNLQVVVDNTTKGPDNSPTPGAQRFIPRDDRRAMAHAFYALGRTVRWLKRVNKGLTEREIEDVLREQYREALRRANIIERMVRAA